MQVHENTTKSLTVRGVDTTASLSSIIWFFTLFLNKLNCPFERKILIERWVKMFFSFFRHKL